MLSSCFSHFSLNQLSIPNELLDHLSLLNFDGEVITTINEHIYDLIHFCESQEIDSDELVCILFFLTLEVCVNRWCHTLPPASIRSLLTFLKELHQAFDVCDHQDAYERISQLRMNPRESVEDFSSCFVHLCHEIPK